MVIASAADHVITVRMISRHVNDISMSAGTDEAV